MAATRSDHPLALLFWSQIGLAYALPAILGIASRCRGEDEGPGRALHVCCALWPIAMLALAAALVVVDFGRIYRAVLRGTRRLPSLVVGAVYALAVFVALALWREGLRNATNAWADYVMHGSANGMLVLLLALVVEVFATTLLVCHLVALVRRWRRLGRAAPVAAPPRN